MSKTLREQHLTARVRAHATDNGGSFPSDLLLGVAYVVEAVHEIDHTLSRIADGLEALVAATNRVASAVECADGNYYGAKGYDDSDDVAIEVEPEPELDDDLEE